VEKQIPFEDDRKKSNGNSNDKINSNSQYKGSLHCARCASVEMTLLVGLL
jgi:hypothetical protein